jgi:hypothetical protein
MGAATSAWSELSPNARFEPCGMPHTTAYLTSVDKLVLMWDSKSDAQAALPQCCGK